VIPIPAPAEVGSLADLDEAAGHRLRHGFATTAARRGVADRTITRHAWHRSRTTLDAYIDEEADVRDNAASYIGL
jgi:site-specific recombinase XerD